MTLHCEWPCLSKGARCIRCGYDLKMDYQQAPVRACEKPAEPCPHFLGSTGESVLVFGCGCASDKKNGAPISVCGCELHGRCVEFNRGTHLSDETVKRCATCDDNPANRSSAPAE